MTDSKNLPDNTIKLFRTGEHACSYLDDSLSRTLFVDPDLVYSLDLYEELTHAGFRRSGKHLYRPDCKACHSCIPSRLPISSFKFSKSQKRIFNKNADLTLSIHPSTFRDTDYNLFQTYINERHSDGDMHPTSEENYRDFLAIDKEYSFHIHFHLDNKLIAVAVTDRLKTGLSAIYTYFDPTLDIRSLGVFSVLAQIQLAKKWNLPYLYLGYWVPGCRKMKYKTNYKPIELLINGQWESVVVKKP